MRLNPKLNNFSTNEEKIGTWIDGKPIYRMVISSTTPSSSTVATVGTISNTDLVINLYGYLTAGNNQRIPLNFVYNTEQCSLYKEGNYIKCRITATGYQSKSCIIVAEYTKTTD